MKIISSMATRALLAELAEAAGQALELTVSVESVGGVDAAKRVRAGETFDAVVLASDVIDALIAEGHALPGSRVDLVRSEVAVAVPAGAPVPDISSAAALRQAMLAAPSLGYSTGPSGNALLRYIDSWGLSETLRPRLVQAPAGVPVAITSPGCNWVNCPIWRLISGVAEMAWKARKADPCTTSARVTWSGPPTPSMWLRILPSTNATRSASLR